MLIRGALPEQIEQALSDTNAHYDTTLRFGDHYQNNGLRPKGKGWNLVLRLREPGVFSRRALSGRCSCSASHTWWGATRCPSGIHNARRLSCVCWHGHREFMRALFALAPDARITTGIITYKGSEDFERTHNETGYRNIGSQMAPVAGREACDCYDDGDGSIHMRDERYPNAPMSVFHSSYEPDDTYGDDEACGAANAAMANALAVGAEISKARREARKAARSC